MSNEATPPEGSDQGEDFNMEVPDLTSGELAGVDFDQELQALSDDPDTQQVKRIANIHKEFQAALESSNPKIAHAVNIARELQILEDQIELQTMVADTLPYSELDAADTKIGTQIDAVIRDRVGDEVAMDIDEWLGRPKVIAIGESTATGTNFRVESYPGRTVYGTRYVSIRSQGEYLRHDSADFHGTRTHDVKYHLDLAETTDTTEKGYRLDYRGMMIKADYHTDVDGRVVPETVKQVEVTRTGERGGSVSSLYVGDQALVLVRWLEHKAASLTDKVHVDGSNSELYAHDLEGQRHNYGARYAKVTDLDLEAERKIIQSWKSQ